MAQQAFHVWYATEKKINGIFKVSSYDDTGVLTLSNGRIWFVGKRVNERITGPFEAALKKQKDWFVYLILANILIFALFLFLRRSIEFSSNIKLAIALFLFLNAFGFVSAHTAEWVSIEWLDQSGEKRKAFFSVPSIPLEGGFGAAPVFNYIWVVFHRLITFFRRPTEKLYEAIELSRSSEPLDFKNDASAK